MSKIALTPSATGTGVFTISSPATSTNRTLVLPDEAGTIITTAGVPSSAMPAGSVLQVVNAVKTDAQSTTSTSPVDITGLSVSITPSSTSSKILVMAKINLLSMADSNLIMIRLLRDSTVITSNSSGGLADANAAWVSGGGGGVTLSTRKINSGALDFLDSPTSIATLTYKMQMMVNASTGSINRWQLNNDLASVSSITLMEIAG